MVDPPPVDVVAASTLEDLTGTDNAGSGVSLRLQRLRNALQPRAVPSLADFQKASQKTAKFAKRYAEQQKRSAMAMEAINGEEEENPASANCGLSVEEDNDDADDDGPVLRLDFHLRCFNTTGPASKKQKLANPGGATDPSFDGITDEDWAKFSDSDLGALLGTDPKCIKEQLQSSFAWNPLLDIVARMPQVPAVVTRVLFNMLATPSVSQQGSCTSQQAFKYFRTLLGRRPAHDPDTSPHAVPDWHSAAQKEVTLCSRAVSEASLNRLQLEWLPTSADFQEKLEALGYANPTVEKLRSVELFDMSQPWKTSKGTPVKRSRKSHHTTLPNQDCILNLGRLYRLLVDLDLLKSESLGNIPETPCIVVDPPEAAEGPTADLTAWAMWLNCTLDSRFAIIARDDLLFTAEAAMNRLLHKKAQRDEFLSADDRAALARTIPASDPFLQAFHRAAAALIGPTAKECKDGRDGQLLPQLLHAMPDWRFRSKQTTSKPGLSIELVRSIMSMVALRLIDVVVADSGITSSRSSPAKPGRERDWPPGLNQCTDCRRFVEASHAFVVQPLQRLKCEWQAAEKAAGSVPDRQRAAARSRAAMLARQVQAAIHLSEAAIRPLMLWKHAYDDDLQRCDAIEDGAELEIVQSPAAVRKDAGLSAGSARSEWWQAIKHLSAVKIQDVEAFSASQAAKSTATDKFDFNQDLVERYRG